ncbi:MAG TPA: hypothetical protein VE684_21065, partial [Crenalkalicoccus sp.]|nr:hypothetical protein [Crenalkalicoccus sp.]
EAAPASTLAAAPPTRPTTPPGAELQDADRLLHEAEAAMEKHRLRAAVAMLEQAETVMLKARATGTSVPQQALEPLHQARGELLQGHAAEAERATEAAQRALASAE